ncbi:MAG: hypothetical protein A3K46_00215 [Chloroflexi bacterium RBG_13_60_9]|nr:MAG: hypothetical protein A3K46_00215 [Chloroflexi bacterium RBG_13_60_9]
MIEEPDWDSFSVKLIAIAEKLALMRSHILPSRRIADMFRFTGARIRVEAENRTAWIIVENIQRQ